jgi:hypothetical protein
VASLINFNKYKEEFLFFSNFSEKIKMDRTGLNSFCEASITLMTKVEKHRIEI